VSWSPIPPRTPKQLAELTAHLCRLLRDEVSEQLDAGDPRLLGLADDWRKTLFADADNTQFADGYAQAVTFGLLLARAQSISLTGGLAEAAKALAGQHSVIGTALRMLTDNVVKERILPTSVAVLGRVLEAVEWAKISKGRPEAWLYFYEDFLAEYDNALRKRTGSYYTPSKVVEAMTMLVDEALRTRFGLPLGIANAEVTVADPAMGTGTFLLETMRTVGTKIEADLGVGAVGESVKDYLTRLIGFELQVGPFAVAQLRLLAELTAIGVGTVPPDALRLYLTNTLGNPYLEEETLGSWYEPISESRRQANTIKRDEPILVVIGNPPYKEKSHGGGAWIESGSPGSNEDAALMDFIPPRDWGVGAHVKHLYNPYVYFWRWATWKVFDHHPMSDQGIVCFITVAGFLDGPGFEKMRDYLRRRADAIWIIDCSPEGHQPEVATRVFQSVQQPVCIMLALRDGSLNADTPAPVYFWQLAPGMRQAKFAELGDLSLAEPGWLQCANDWRAPFLPAGAARWLNYPAVDDLLRWSGSGMMPGRTWVVAPDKRSLQQRWDLLVTAAPSDKPVLMLEHPTDRRVDTLLSDGLPGYNAPHNRISEESGPCPDPVLIGYRSFDRQWIIPDKRLINRPNPTLWSVRSNAQIYLTAPQRDSPTSGPAATFSALVPDLHHFKGSFGGRAYPLWLDPNGKNSNVAPRLVSYLGDIYGYRVEPADVFAYLAAILANPGFPVEFKADLSTPGLRLPLTADPTLFKEAVRIGERVLWLHTYGQRFYDEAAGRPKSAPRMSATRAPKLTRPIAATPDQMPDALSHDPNVQELRLGTGVIANVTSRMFSYDISGVNVLAKWFGYRRKNRGRPKMGDRRVSALQRIQPDHWLPEYTSNLIDLLNVLGLLIDLEEKQLELLHAILRATQIGVDSLTAGGVLPMPPDARKPVRWSSPEDIGTLF
jgi:hypothetical protein